AAAILARRANDGTSVVTPYTPGAGLGVWIPTPPAFAPAIGVSFGKVKSFMAQFQLPKPAYFKLSSPEYAADYNEVKSIGGAHNKTRTPQQSENARFSYEPSPPGLFPLARDPGVTRKTHFWENARRF